MSRHSYDWVPSRMRGPIERWVREAVVPGHFLRAIITNDLRGAFARADQENGRLIQNYLALFYNDLPSGCWGPSDALANWKGQPDWPLPWGSEGGAS